MKSNTKFLWFYTIVLFSFALVLVLIAGLTQQNYEEELKTHLTANVGMQQSVSELSRVNTSLQEKVNKYEAQIEETEAKIEETTKELENLNTLVDALKEYEKGNKSSARKSLADINADELTPNQRYVYNKVMR